MSCPEDFLQPPVETALGSTTSSNLAVINASFKQRSLLHLNIPQVSLPALPLARDTFSGFRNNSFDCNSSLNLLQGTLGTSAPFKFPLHPVRNIHTHYHISRPANLESARCTLSGSPLYHPIPTAKLILRKVCRLLFQFRWCPATPFPPAGDIHRHDRRARNLQRGPELQHLRQLRKTDTDCDDGGRDRSREGEEIGMQDRNDAAHSSVFCSRRLASSSTPPLNKERSKAAPAARRPENIAHRTDPADAEPAFEIGSGLLTEVRRLKSLGARRKIGHDRKTEKEFLEKSSESVGEPETGTDDYHPHLEDTVREVRRQLSVEPKDGAEAGVEERDEDGQAAQSLGLALPSDPQPHAPASRDDLHSVWTVTDRGNGSGDETPSYDVPVAPSTYVEQKSADLATLVVPETSTMPQPAPPRALLLPNVAPEHHCDVLPPRPSSSTPPDLIQCTTTPTFGAMMMLPGKGSHDETIMPPSAQLSLHKERSSVSLVSERSHSLMSDHSEQDMPQQHASPAEDEDVSSYGPTGSPTDPTIVHAITQTLVGDFLYKYTRKTIGKGYGARHRRFFWVHPYTKILYWSATDPGSSKARAKSARINGVRSVLDWNTVPPGLYQYSIIVSTAQRELKITAPTKERHDIWLLTLTHLLAGVNTLQVSPSLTSDFQQRSQLSVGGSSSKSSGTLSSPPTLFLDVPGHEADLHCELHRDSMEENVPDEDAPPRPVSSAWSFRSRTSSIRSRNGGNSFLTRAWSKGAKAPFSSQGGCVAKNA